MRLGQQDHKKGCECKPNCRSWAVWPNEHFLSSWFSDCLTIVLLAMDFLVNPMTLTLVSSFTDQRAFFRCETERFTLQHVWKNDQAVPGWWKLALFSYCCTTRCLVFFNLIFINFILMIRDFHQFQSSREISMTLRWSLCIFCWSPQIIHSWLYTDHVDW